jgi:hypothetical protein
LILLVKLLGLVAPYAEETRSLILLPRLRLLVTAHAVAEAEGGIERKKMIFDYRQRASLPEPRALVERACCWLVVGEE